MDITEAILKAFRRNKRPESLESIDFSDSSALDNDLIASINQSLPLEKSQGQSHSIPQTLTVEYKPQEISKDSFQLGLAAGYTGRSIKSIEESLGRMEIQMVTKDWFKTEFQDSTPELLELLKSTHKLLQEHEDNENKRFSMILESLNKMRTIADHAPEPIRHELKKEIEIMENNIPLSNKMRQLVEIVSKIRDISYEDLAQMLTISVSALRGLLSTTLQRTQKIERYTKEGKGWVRYKQL